MIFFYTRSQKTKVFAEALHELLNLPLYHLKSGLDDMKDFKFLIKSLGMVFSGKGFPVDNMPDSVPDEIYVCGPVWGGGFLGPHRYFLENMDLSTTKVHLIMTASMPVLKYKAKAEEMLAKINCIPGEVHLFATGKDKDFPDKDVAKEHLRDLLFGEASQQANTQ